MFSESQRKMRRVACTVLVAGGCLAGAAPAGAATSFVVGNQSAQMGAHVTFWGAKWHKLNSLSGGSAPAAFKGFANELTEPVCGATWTTDPGNSSEPPEGPLPGLIEAVASSQIVKHGRLISGDVTAVVLIATEPGYAADPGHEGAGRVVGIGCPGTEERTG